MCANSEWSTRAKESWSEGCTLDIPDLDLWTRLLVSPLNHFQRIICHIKFRFHLKQLLHCAKLFFASSQHCVCWQVLEYRSYFHDFNCLGLCLCPNVMSWFQNSGKTARLSVNIQRQENRKPVSTLSLNLGSQNFSNLGLHIEVNKV